MSGRRPRRPGASSTAFAAVLVASCGGVASVGCRGARTYLAADVAAFRRVETTTPADAPSLSADPFLAGLEPLSRSAEALALDAAAVAAGPHASPATRWLDEIHDEFRALLPRIGLVRTGVLYAFGASVEIPGATPARCAQILLDVQAEQAALSADEAVERRSAVVPGGERRMARFGLLRMGEGPFTYDFRWTFVGTSHARADGIVLVRFDFVPADDPQHVSAFSGVTMLLPRAGGTLLAEAFGVGSPLSPPFFIKNKARRAVEDILTKRVVRLRDRIAASK